MKKTFLAAALGTLIASPALAQTQGNYLGLSLINTQTKNYDAHGEHHQGSNESFGINYKYAFNFNNVFVAPGLFYDFNNVKNKFYDNGNSDNYTGRLKYSYGVKLDLGYDFTPRLAAFGTIGFAQNRLGSTTNSSVNPVYNRGNETKESIIYGLGAKYAINKNVDLSGAYELSRYNGVNKGKDPYANDYRVVRVSLAYNF